MGPPWPPPVGPPLWAPPVGPPPAFSPPYRPPAAGRWGPPTAWGPPPPGGPARFLNPAGVVDRRIHLSRKSAWLALAGLVMAIGFAFAGVVVAALVAPGVKLVTLLLSQAGLWAGLLIPVVVASRRYGSGNVARDFGVSFQGRDALRGFLASLAARVAGLVALIPVVMANPKLAGGNQPFGKSIGDPALFAVLVVIVVLGAPLVEELFFRGLVMASLVPMLGQVGALGGQAVVFALMHLRPPGGLGNVGLFVAIGVMGVVQGVLAERYRRLGPAMACHAFFNLVSLLAFLATR